MEFLEQECGSVVNKAAMHLLSRYRIQPFPVYCGGFEGTFDPHLTRRDTSWNFPSPLLQRVKQFGVSRQHLTIKGCPGVPAPKAGQACAIPGCTPPACYRRNEVPSKALPRQDVARKIYCSLIYPVIQNSLRQTNLGLGF